MIKLPNSLDTEEYIYWKQVHDNVSPKAAHRFYLKSQHWKQCRTLILERDERTCQRCNTHEKNTSEGYLHVHHRSYVRLWHERPKDLVSVCTKCHGAIHKHGKISQVGAKPSSKIASPPKLKLPKVKTTKKNKSLNTVAKRVAYCREIVAGTIPIPYGRPINFPRTQWKKFRAKYNSLFRLGSGGS